MKRIITMAALAALFACNQTQEKKATATIELSVTGVPSEKVYLLTQVEGELDTLGEADIVEGKASIPLEIEQPQMVMVSFKDLPQPWPTFCNPEGFTLDLDFNQMPPKSFTTGNIYQEQFDEYMKIEEDFNAQFEQFRPLMAQAQTDQVINQLLQHKIDSMRTIFDNATIDFAIQNDVVGAFIANQRLPMAEYDELNKIYQNIDVRYSSAPAVKMLKERVDKLKKTSIGEPYTNLTGVDTTGTEIDIDRYQKESKLLLIDFWASWCRPCRMANPAMVSVYNDYHDKGFEIVGVSLDNSEVNWKQAVKDDGLPWPQMSDLLGPKSEHAKTYGIVAIPQSIVVNQYGTIVVKNLNEVDLREYLEENL